MDAQSIPGEFFFGPFRVVPSARLLERNGAPVSLGSRAFDLLSILVSRAGEVVSKGELMANTWPGLTVDESSLRFHITQLRRALGDSPDGEPYIANVTGRGYSFVAMAPRSSVASPSAAEVTISDAGPTFPARLGRMIGRDTDVKKISSRLLAGRFVTVTGTGGIGKTTVAVSVGRSLLSEFGGLVHFIDLGSLRDPVLVASATASALNLPVNESDPVPNFVAALRARRMLLVFDNCEHVIETVSLLIERLSKDLPQIHILATSREPLRVEGEHVHRLVPLEYPSEAGNLTAPEALAFPAVLLFIERATANHPHFVFSDVDAPIVAEICRKLDGIALAIELAAGRVSAFGIQGVAMLLEQKLGLLWHGSRTASPRHKTLTATLDWSYDLLQEPERLTLRRLSVFAGIFTLEAARSIVVENDVDDAIVVNSIAGLVAKSLVATNPSEGIASYRLLDTTRVYAQEKLIESGEADRFAHRHAVYYRELLGHIDTRSLTWRKAELTKRDQTGNLTGVSISTHGRVIDEVRAALDWAYSDRGDLTLAASLTAAAAPLWINHTLIDECRERVEQAIALVGEKILRDPDRDLRLFSTLAVAHMESTGDASKVDLAWSRAAELAEELDDREYRLRSLWGLWYSRYLSGNFRGALEIATRFATLPGGDLVTADRFVGERILGVTLHILGDQSRARLHFENMIRGYVAPSGQTHIQRYLFDQLIAARTFYANVLWLLGFPDQAIAAANGALDEATTLGHQYSLHYTLIYGVCPLTLQLGNFGGMEQLIAKMFERSKTFRPMEAWAKCYEGILKVKTGDTEPGVVLLRDGLKGLSKRSFGSQYLCFLGNLAIGMFDAGDRRGAMATIDDALEQSEKHEDRWFVAELLRIKGEFELGRAEPDSAAAAEVHFRHSLSWSRRQKALSWELRTTISLARLLKQQDRTDEARELLEPIYRQFTEGFTTRDLLDARSLLTALGAPLDLSTLATSNDL